MPNNFHLADSILDSVYSLPRHQHTCRARFLFNRAMQAAGRGNGTGRGRYRRFITGGRLGGRCGSGMGRGSRSPGSTGATGTALLAVLMRTSPPASLVLRGRPTPVMPLDGSPPPPLATAWDRVDSEGEDGERTGGPGRLRRGWPIQRAEVTLTPTDAGAHHHVSTALTSSWFRVPGNHRCTPWSSTSRHQQRELRRCSSGHQRRSQWLRHTSSGSRSSTRPGRHQPPPSPHLHWPLPPPQRGWQRPGGERRQQRRRLPTLLRRGGGLSNGGRWAMGGGEGEEGRRLGGQPTTTTVAAIDPGACGGSGWGLEP